MKKEITVAAFTVASAMSLSAASYGNGNRDYTSSGWQNAGNPSIPSSSTTVSTYNNTAIQNGLDNRDNIGGGKVQLKNNKTYWSTATIELRSNCRIDGYGQGQSLIRRSTSWNGGNNQALLRALNRKIDEFLLSDLTLDGAISESNLLQGNMKVNGFYDSTANTSKYSEKIKLFNVHVSYMENGVLLSGIKDLRIQNSTLKKSGYSNLKHNCYVRRIAKCYINNNDIIDGLRGTGFKAWGGTFNVTNESKYFYLRNNYISGNEKRNIEPNGVGYSRIEGNECDNQDNNTPDGSIFLGWGGSSSNKIGVHYTDVINNKVEGNDGYGIRVEYANRLHIQGNRCRNNGSNYSISNSINTYSDNNAN